MKKFTKIIALVLCFALIAAFAACAKDGGSETAAPAGDETAAPAGDETAAPAADGEAFKIGLVGPLTGPAAIYGNAAKNGAQIAVDEINAKGGIQFAYQAQDDEHDAEKSVNAYNTLVDWGMQALVGPITTTPAVAVSAEAANDRIFCLTPSASSTDVIDGKDNMFQVCFTDPNQGTASADYIAENLAGKSVAVIYRNDDAYSQGIRDTFVKEAEAKGIDVVYEGTFTDATSTDFSVQLTEAQSKNAEVVFLPIYYTPASVILKQAADMDYAPTFFGVDGMDGILTVEGFDTSLAEGVMLLTPFSADDPNAKDFVDAYQAAYGEVPNQFAADAYDAVYIIYQALQSAGCTPDMAAADICEALVAQMATISVDGLTGQGMTWDESGAVSKAPMAVVIKDGAYVTP
ncbi:MAG: ABC transporter substrate-binding protein [Clostridia bacterium]|nr:ABC transporter substrate-binding protein [Clostridia bacterium]